MHKRGILCAVITLLASSSAFAADLTGSWEIQSMGGDRTVTVENVGTKLAVHRVLWPEFEGKAYKLEHLYRGTIAGSSISGDLLVKDDEAKHYEILRTFEGSISGPTQIKLDGFPIIKKGEPSAATAAPKFAPPTPEAPSPPHAPSPPPVATPKATPTPQTAPKATPAPQTAPKATPAPSGSLLRETEKVETSSRRTQFIKEGDAAYAAGDYDEAMSKYRMAAKTARGFPASVMHRMGRTHLKLKEYIEAQKWLRRAMRLDPANQALQDDYARAKAN